MMDLALPNLHPAVVHLPIVLIPLAAVLDAASIWLRSTIWNRVGAACWGVAALGTTAAFMAGRAAADGLVDLDPLVQPLVADHANWATWTVAGVVSVTVLRVVVLILGSKTWPGVLVWATSLAVGVALLGALFWTADLGGALVYKHAVAVNVPDCPECWRDDTSHSTDPPDAPTEELVAINGTLTWKPTVADLERHGVSPWRGGGTTVEVQGQHRLLLPPVFGDVQINAWLDLRYFDGEVRLLHHVNGDRAGALVVQTNGSVTLVDMAAEERVLASGTVGEQRRLALAVSVTGSHLKGLLEGRTVVHGHAPALPNGQVGLAFSGRGNVEVVRLEVVPLAPAE